MGYRLRVMGFVLGALLLALTGCRDERISDDPTLRMIDEWPIDVKISSIGRPAKNGIKELASMEPPIIERTLESTKDFTHCIM